MIAIDEATTQELFQIYERVLAQLRTREVLRSSNNPIADYSEWLAKKAFGLDLQPKSTRGFDGLCEGLKYEVKGRRLSTHNKSVQLSAIRGLDKKHFDFLIAIIYNTDFSIAYAGKIPHDVVVERSTYRAHTNASIFHFRRDVLEDERVVDVTELLTQAALS